MDWRSTRYVPGKGKREGGRDRRRQDDGKIHRKL